MSDMILGAAFTLLYLSSLYGAYMLGRRSQKPHTAPQSREVNEQEKRRAEALQKGFSELMSYDVKTALGKKVT